jgi:hypothetical protein
MKTKGDNTYWYNRQVVVQRGAVGYFHQSEQFHATCGASEQQQKKKTLRLSEQRIYPGNLPPAHRISEVVSDNRIMGSHVCLVASRGKTSRNIDAAPDI